MPTPRSPSRRAAFARFTAPRTASWSNGWSETSVGTRTPRTRAGKPRARKTSRTARTLTGLPEPTDTSRGLRQRPRRSINPCRIRREEIGRPSCASTIGTARMARRRRPFAARASFRARATGIRSAETTITSRSGRSSAGPNGSSIASIRARLHLRAAKRRLRLRSRTEKALTSVRDSFAKRSVVRPMTTSSGRPSKAEPRRASWPAWRTSKVPPSTTRIWWTIRSARYKNDSGDQPALANREEIGVDRIGGLPQSRVALDDLELLQHVRPHDERARRAVDGEERMVRRDRLQGDGGEECPSPPRTAGDELDPVARGPGGLDARGGEGRDALPANLLRPASASHQGVDERACLDRRVPAVQVHRGIRLDESHLPSGGHAFLVGPARFDLR